MIGTGPAYIGLSILLLPGQPITAADDASTVSDSWALTASESVGTTIVSTPARVLLQQPSLSGISGHFNVAPVQGNIADDLYAMQSWQPSPYTGDGLFVPTAQDLSAKTGFAPANRATAQMGSHDVAGTSVAQYEGGVCGAYLNAADLAVTGADRKMMITPAYHFPDPHPVLWPNAGTVFHGAFDMQVPWAVGNSVYCSYSLRMIDPSGVRIAYNMHVFHHNMDAPADPVLSYDAPSTSYIFNMHIGQSSQAAYFTTDAASAAFNNDTWTGWRHFEWTVSYAQFAAALTALNAANPGVLTSLDPKDYTVDQAHGNFEFHDQQLPAELGWSFKGLALWTDEAIADTWNLSATDAAVSSVYSYYTEPSLATLLPWSVRDAFTDKAQAFATPQTSLESWSLSWTEDSVDNVQLDVWDAWLISADQQVTNFVRSQTFPATDAWAFALSEASTLTVTSSQQDLTPNDLWSVTLAPESATLFKDVPLTDGWSLQANDVSQPRVIPEDLTDTWSISFTAEGGSTAVSGVITQDATDAWSLSLTETVQLAFFQALAPSETWTLTAADAAGLMTSGTMDLTDTWTVRTDEGVTDIRPSPMDSDITDTWQVSTLSEIASISNIPMIDIIGSDEWKLSVSESVNVFSAATLPPEDRRITPADNRTIYV